MPRLPLPTDLVQHVARQLLERSRDIKLLPKLIREISLAPLPVADFKAQHLIAPLSQWRLDGLQNTASASLFQRLKTALGQQLDAKSFSQLTTKSPHTPAADLVFAPLVLDVSDDILAQFEYLPNWFASDGVLLFATLSAGGLPELVNAQPEWLELLQHWPNIMDAGARLQALRFSLPVLDVETTPLEYADFETLWQDVCALLPILATMAANEQNIWRDKLAQLFTNGLRTITLQIMYGQVWQVTAPKDKRTEHTISLDSLVAQLDHQKTRP